MGLPLKILTRVSHSNLPESVPARIPHCHFRFKLHLLLNLEARVLQFHFIENVITTQATLTDFDHPYTTFAIINTDVLQIGLPYLKYQQPH